MRTPMFGNTLRVALLVLAAAPATAQEAIELPATDRPLEADFAQVFRLGSLDAPAWQQFGMLDASAFDAAGNLYLLDVDARTIIVVDRAGGLVRTIGQPGDGSRRVRLSSGSGDPAERAYRGHRHSPAPDLSDLQQRRQLRPWCASGERPVGRGGANSRRPRFGHRRVCGLGEPRAVSPHAAG